MDLKTLPLDSAARELSSVARRVVAGDKMAAQFLELRLEAFFTVLKRDMDNMANDLSALRAEVAQLKAR